MSDVTRILSQINDGDPSAAEQLLPLVYEELRKLAATKMAQERPGQTLQATALVHEAYIRLVDVEKVQSWESRGHFFAAAAEAMRRILVDRARHRETLRAGGSAEHVELESVEPRCRDSSRVDLLGPQRSASASLKSHDRRKAELVKAEVLRGFDDACEQPRRWELPCRTAMPDWAYAKGLASSGDVSHAAISEALEILWNSLNLSTGTFAAKSRIEL